MMHGDPEPLRGGIYIIIDVYYGRNPWDSRLLRGIHVGDPVL